MFARQALRALRCGGGGARALPVSVAAAAAVRLPSAAQALWQPRRGIAGSCTAHNDASAGPFGGAGDGPKPELSFEDHVEFAETHLDILLNEKLWFSKNLVSIKENAGGAGIMEQWQGAMQVYLGSQVHCMTPYGYTADMVGLNEFNRDHTIAMKDPKQGADLVKLFRERWNAVTEQAFGISLLDGPGMNLDQARHYSGVLSFQMQSDAFMKQVDDAVENLPGSANSEEADLQKQQAVLSVLAPLQRDIGDQCGFSGDDGFIRLQAALLEHATDDQIMYQVSTGTMAVFQRAGITMPGQ